MTPESASTLLGLRLNATSEEIENAFARFRRSVEEMSGEQADEAYLAQYFPDVVSAYSLLRDLPAESPEVETEQAEIPPPPGRLRTFATYLITLVIFVLLIAFLHQLAFFTL